MRWSGSSSPPLRTSSAWRPCSSAATTTSHSLRARVTGWLMVSPVVARGPPYAALAMQAEVIDAGDGVRLRPMRDEDCALLVEWRNTPHVRKWWDPDDPPYTLAQ